MGKDFAKHMQIFLNNLNTAAMDGHTGTTQAFLFLILLTRKNH